jgi:1-acyl-sn-glycerol-3-phosphate acyltransferase
MLGTGLLGRAAGAIAPPLSANLTMVRAMLGDVAHALDPLGITPNGSPEDWLDARDPDYIRASLPAIRAWSDYYFRAEVEGLEHIPAEEPALLVGNHSGGTLIADTFVFSQHFYDHFGAEREFHQLAHDLVFQVPGFRASLSRFGTVPANPDNMRRALDRGAALLVYPGGDHETYRPTWEQDEINFAGRTGFAKLSLELGTPIVPVVAIGGQETALFLGQGQRLARLLALDRMLRLKVFPVQVAPPLGVTVLDLPLRMPLPSKITIRVLPPIDLREELGAKAGPEDAYKLVTGRMQECLDDLADERAIPIIG